MSGPFKMKNSGLSHSAKHKSPVEYASPAKKAVKVDMNDPKVKANYDKYKDNPEYRKALDKQAGGKFDYDKKSNTSTTKTDI